MSGSTGMNTSTSKIRNGRWNRDLLNGPIMQALIMFMLPILGANLFQQLYNTVDTMIVGHILGEESLAAIGAASPVYVLLVAVSLGMGNGLAIVTARAFGQQDEEKLKRAVAHAIMIAAGTALIMTVVSLACSRQLLVLLNTPSDILDEAESYTSVVLAFTAVTLTYNLCAGILRSVGNSLMPLVFLMISSILNIFLDLLLIPQMGVRGAAVATVVSQGISAFLCLIYISRKARFLIPSGKHFTFDPELFKDMLGQGISMALMSCIVDLGTLILQYGINGMGAYIIAAHTTARKMFTLFTMPFSAMGMSISTFASQNRGADQPGRIRRALKLATIYNITLTVVIALLLQVAARFMIRLVSGSDNEELLYYGSMYMRCASPFFWVVGEVFIFRYSLQGIGRKIIPLISSVIELIGKVIFTFLLVPVYHYWAVIFCEPVIWCFMTVSLVIAFYTDPYIRQAGKRAVT